MAGKNPPPITAPSPFNVGDMVGLGPSPGWQYTNAVKVGSVKSPIPNTNPVQYIEYDDLEYIHPQWDKTLDYSKIKMPGRVWFNGMLYSPGRWLTTVKRGTEPNTAMCNPGDPRFRTTMNYPANDDPTDRVINQSHAFRVWKPNSKHLGSQGVDMSAPDGVTIITMPVCTAHERENHSTDSKVNKMYYPNAVEPYEWEVKTNPPAAGQPSSTQVFAIKNYDQNNPENNPLAVSSKTGKMTTSKIICVNSESDFGDWWFWWYYDPYYSGYDYGHTYHAHLGVSLSNLFTQSQTTTSSFSGTVVPGYNGYKNYTWKDTLSIGDKAPENHNHLVGIEQYHSYGWAGYPNFYNYGFYNGYYQDIGGLENISRYGCLDYRPAESHYTKVGNQWQFKSVEVNPPNDSASDYYGGYYRTYYKETIKRNLFLSIQHPLFFMRTATVQLVKTAGSSVGNSTWPDCNTATTTTVTNTETYKGEDKQLVPKQHSITIAGSSPTIAPTGGFLNNTYFNDAHSLGNFTMVWESRTNSTWQRGSGYCAGGRDNNDATYSRDEYIHHVKWST